jgi:hypothetical protein
LSSLLLYSFQASIGDQTQNLMTEITASNPHGSIQKLASSVLGQDLMEARAHSRSWSPVPNTQQSVQCTAHHQSSSLVTDQVQSNLDAVAADVKR